VGQNIPTFLPFTYQLFPSLKGDPLVPVYLQIPADWSNWAYIPGVFLLSATLGGAVLLFFRQARFALLWMGSCTLVVMTYFWPHHVKIFSDYSQGSAQAVIEKYKTRPETLVFYGPLTFVPPYYGRRQVFNPHTEKDLQAIVQQHPDLVVFARGLDIPLIQRVKPVHQIDQAGPWLVLETVPPPRPQATRAPLKMLQP